jgi:hypothetical protein
MVSDCAVAVIHRPFHLLVVASDSAIVVVHCLFLLLLDLPHLAAELGMMLTTLISSLH